MEHWARPCVDRGVTQSMGAVGASADNALAESSNATLTRKILRDAACRADEATCRREAFRRVTRYDTRRSRSRCGYQSPSAYESLHAATLPSAASSTPVSTFRGKAQGAGRVIGTFIALAAAITRCLVRTAWTSRLWDTDPLVESLKAFQAAGQ
ncbi:MAG: integrase core domain-containing protein [Aeromicrobium sp.]|uniref:integrase core domain-containing protein n=1 Tax=Aeromicrobium sp. TaxID=1871063 RepID=UPI0039E700EA